MARGDSAASDRPIDVGYTTPVESEEEDSTAPSLSGEAPSVPGPPRPPRYQHLEAGVTMLAGSLGGEDYDGFALLGLTFGTTSDRGRVDGVLSLGSVSFKGESKLGQSFKDAGDLRLDVMARYYLTHPHTFLGLYPVAGAGIGMMMWDFAGPVVVLEDGRPKTIESDAITHYSFYGGAGMSLLQTRHLHLGGNLVGGVRFYGWQTHEGLKNDMLPTTGFVQFMMDVNYHWRDRY